MAVEPAFDATTAPDAAEEDSDDGDFVDDTPPGPGVSEVAPSDEPEVAPPVKAKPRKRAAPTRKAAEAKVNAKPKAKTAEVVAKAPTVVVAKAAAPKPHRKHKGRVASKQP